MISIVKFKKYLLRECEIAFNNYIREKHIQKENIMNVTINKQNNDYELIAIIWK